MKNRNTLGASERLKSRKTIGELFRNGRKLNNPPLVIYYKVEESGVETKSRYTGSVQMGAGVSSKHFRHAVDRNRVKRMIREAYRTRNTMLKDLLQTENKKLILFFIYSGKMLPDWTELTQKMDLILQQLFLLISKK